MAAVFTAVDLAGVSTFVGASMLIVIAVALAFKAGIIGKRAIKAV